MVNDSKKYIAPTAKHTIGPHELLEWQAVSESMLTSESSKGMVSAFRLHKCLPEGWVGLFRMEESILQSC
jgi:hypothetical protein